MNRVVIRSLQYVCLGAILLGASGCQMFYFLTPERKEKIPAEYSQIGARKVGVLVWAEQSTLDMDPLARLRVCKPVTYYMKQNMPDAKFVEPITVAEFQERSGLDWEGMSANEVCKQLKCDLLLRIDLLEYTTRALSARELRKGRVRGTVNLYSTEESAGVDPVYRAEVVATYPPSSTQGVLDQSDADILRECVDEFGLAVARKFYDHEIAYTETGRRKERGETK